MNDTELRAHLSEKHPGIGQANMMYPQGRPTLDLETAHDLQHSMFPDGMSHVHQDGHMMTLVAVEKLTEGQAADLENDQYADPFGFRGEEHDPEEGTAEVDHMYYQDMYARVEAVEQETPDCTLVYFDQAAVGFPHGYRVRVDETVSADE